MRKLSGWLLIVIGGIYPAILVLLWLFVLFILITTGGLNSSPEQLLGAIWPLALIVSVVFLLAGVYLVKNKKKNKEENNAK